MFELDVSQTDRQTDPKLGTKSIDNEKLISSSHAGPWESIFYASLGGINPSLWNFSNVSTKHS